MRPDQQNRRSCIGLLLFLAVLAAVIAWMALGVMPGQMMQDDPKGTVGSGAPPPGAQQPAPPAAR